MISLLLDCIAGKGCDLKLIATLAVFIVPAVVSLWLFLKPKELLSIVESIGSKCAAVVAVLLIGVATYPFGHSGVVDHLPHLVGLFLLNIPMLAIQSVIHYGNKASATKRQHVNVRSLAFSGFCLLITYVLCWLLND